MRHLEDNSPTDEIISFTKSNLYIAESKLCDKGVFSRTTFKAGELIECCPLLVFTNEDVTFLKHTNLYNYYALKGREDIPTVLPLGFGSIYNHSSPSNAEYKIDLDKKIATITSVSSIEANTEITINYNGRFNDDNPVEFAQKNEVYEFFIDLL
jgi:uncharacterized protein